MGNLGGRLGIVIGHCLPMVQQGREGVLDTLLDGRLNDKGNVCINIQGVDMLILGSQISSCMNIGVVNDLQSIVHKNLECHSATYMLTYSNPVSSSFFAARREGCCLILVVDSLVEIVPQ